MTFVNYNKINKSLLLTTDDVHYKIFCTVDVFFFKIIHNTKAVKCLKNGYNRIHSIRKGEWFMEILFAIDMILLRLTLILTSVCDVTSTSFTSISKMVTIYSSGQKSPPTYNFIKCFDEVTIVSLLRSSH